LFFRRFRRVFVARVALGDTRRFTAQITQIIKFRDFNELYFHYNKAVGAEAV
jgi:hypothetical protein